MAGDETSPDDSSPARLRRGNTADVPAVLALWVDAGTHRTSTDDTDAVKGLVARDHEALLIAEIDGRMVGTLIAGWDGWRGNLYRLAVVPDVRRRGIAAALVAEAERRFRSLGCRRVTALVVDADPHAVEFWTAVGYEPYPMKRYVRTLGATAGASSW
ncbi:MAG TPA: GNAT family N-acetyltransferase [Acidimicrobiales bacterium]|nr:GNAT family N-acetyltransferase [Acidimicrobiales bacterium]